MPFLARRECIPELMDDPALDPAEHRRALAGLARLNRVSDSPGVLWPAVRELARGGPVRVLDVATGSGDVPRALAAKAAAAATAMPRKVFTRPMSLLKITRAMVPAPKNSATIATAAASQKALDAHSWAQREEHSSRSWE